MKNELSKWYRNDTAEILTDHLSKGYHFDAVENLTDQFINRCFSDKTPQIVNKLKNKTKN